MARYRVNAVAICSSHNYRQSRKLHKNMLERNHAKVMMMIASGEITIEKKPYVKAFGNFIAVPVKEVQAFERITEVFWI